MEAALAVPASKGADVSTGGRRRHRKYDGSHVRSSVASPTQRETLQLVPGAKWFIAGAAHDPRGVTIQGCDVPHSEAPPGVRPSRCGRRGFGAPQSAVGSGWNEAAGAPLLALEQEGPHARGEIRMERAMYFRRQAEVLLGLARATIDLGVARRLRNLAAEFQDKADEFEGDQADFSQMPSGGRGSSSDINRR